MERRNTSGNFLSTEPSISTWETNINTKNESNYDDTSSDCESIFKIMALLSLILALVGMAVNAIVLWFLGFRIRRNAFSVYILNLAGADFLFLCFQFLSCLFDINYFLYFVYSPANDLLTVVANFCYLSGLSLLSAISIERCLSVMWPIWYRCRRPRHTSAVICALLWALSLLLNFLEGKECGYLFSHHVSDWCQTFDFIMGAWLIFSFVVLLGSSLALVVTVFCGSQRIPVTRLYVTILLTVLVFLLFGLPLGINWFIIEWIHNLNNVMHCAFYHVSAFLSCVNSSANPIIYFLVGSFRHRRFQRQTLKVLLHRAMQDTPEEEEHGHTNVLQEIQGNRNKSGSNSELS